MSDNTEWEFSSLQHALRRISAAVHVEALREGEARISLPDNRQVHDRLVLLYSSPDDEPTISDAGHTAFLLGEDFEEVASAMQRAGAPFEIEGDELVFRPWLKDVASEVLRFAQAVSAAPLVWHSMAAEAKQGRERRPQSVQVMARETAAQLHHAFGPRMDGFLRIDKKVRGAADPDVKAPLQLASHRARPPEILVSFIDFSSAPQAQSIAKGQSAYLWSATHHLGGGRFQVVRGNPASVERIAGAFDEQNVTVVSSEDQETLSRSVAEVLESVGV